MVRWFACLLLLVSACSGVGEGQDAGPGSVDVGSQDRTAPADASPTSDGTVAREVLSDGTHADGLPRVDLGDSASDSAADALPPLTDLADVTPDGDGAAVPDTGPDNDSDAVLPDLLPPDDIVQADSAAPDSPSAYEPESVCGSAAHTWLPSEETGHVLEYNEHYIYNLPPEMLLQLAEDAGYPIEIPVSYSSRVFAMRYTTQDRGVLKEATAMVGIPDVADLPGGPHEFATALFLHGTTGYADKCAPSTGMDGGAAAMVPAVMGFIGVAPDYLGMCGFGEPCDDMFHPYLIGEPTAVASLDAVRAAFELIELLGEDLNAVPDYRLVPWGGSQGGHAALFVDRFAPHYAPEFDVSCVVAIVPPADLVGQSEAAFQAMGSAATLGSAFLAASYLWYEPAAPMSSVFNSDGPMDYSDYIPEKFQETCNSNDFFKGVSNKADAYAPEFLAAIEAGGFGSTDPWGCFAGENSLPSTSVPRAGDANVFYIIGENDELVDNLTARQTFENLCDQGYVMQFVECEGLKHTDAAVQTIIMQVEWLFHCLDGNLVEEDQCVITEPQECSAW